MREERRSWAGDWKEKGIQGRVSVRCFAKDNEKEDKVSSASRKRSDVKNGIYRLREKVCAKDEGYREKKLYIDIDEAKNGVYKLRGNEVSSSA